MSWIYDEEEGLVIDEDTGEIEEYGNRHPDDLASYLAARVHNAGEQKNTWERTWRGLRAALLRQMTDPLEVYEDAGVMARMTAKTWPKQDVEGIKAQLEEMELTQDELRQLITAAKGWDPDRLESEPLQKLVRAFTRRETGRTYVTVSALKKKPPRITEEPPE